MLCIHYGLKLYIPNLPIQKEGEEDEKVDYSIFLFHAVHYYTYVVCGSSQY